MLALFCLYRYPWKSNCVPTWPQFFPYQWQPYTRALCKVASIWEETVSVCHCAPPYGSMNGILETDLSIFHYCMNKNERECAEELVRNISQGIHNPQLLPHCNPKCVSVAYEVM